MGEDSGIIRFMLPGNREVIRIETSGRIFVHGRLAHTDGEAARVLAEFCRRELRTRWANRLIPEESLKAERARAEALEDALKDMVWQFAYRANPGARLYTGGLSALEHALEALGWKNPSDKVDEHELAKQRERQAKEDERD